MCFIRKSKQTVNSPQKIPSMVYYQAIFTLSFLLLYLFYFLFLPRMPGNSLLVEVSQYWKKKKFRWLANWTGMMGDKIVDNRDYRYN